MELGGIPSTYNVNVDSSLMTGESDVLNNVKGNGTTEKQQLKKVAKEFESIFITKMLTVMDSTVDKENGIFGKDTQYFDKFKSFMFNELGRELASSPRTTFGFASQIYNQMEKYCKG